MVSARLICEAPLPHCPVHKRGSAIQSDSDLTRIRVRWTRLQPWVISLFRFICLMFWVNVTKAWDKGMHGKIDRIEESHRSYNQSPLYKILPLYYFRNDNLYSYRYCKIKESSNPFKLWAVYVAFICVNLHNYFLVEGPSKGFV